MAYRSFLAALAALVAAVGFSVGDAPKPTTDAFTFAALGDIPYDPDEFPLLRSQIADLEPTLPFVFHVGDIKRSTVPFREDSYSAVADELKRSRVPVFITLGDNEYNDAADPELALSYWKKHLGDLHTHWANGPEVRYQPARRENVAFVHKGVLFVVINLVGGRVHDKREWATRLKDDAEWLAQNFARPGGDVRAAVIIGHAAPDERRAVVRDALVRAASAFAKPVLYIHGDGHRWNQARPFPDARNITRVQVDQGAIAPPVRVAVAATGTAGEMFTFDRRMTPEYQKRRAAYLSKLSKKPKEKSEK